MIVYVLLVAVTSLLLAPVLWMFSLSLKTLSEILEFYPLPINPTLENYYKILFKPETFYGVAGASFPRYILNSLTYAITAATLTIVIVIFAGYAISRFKFRGRTVLSVWILLGQMIPSVLLVIPLFILMRSLQLLNTIPAFVFSYLSFTIPLGVWMMKGFFDSLPIQVEEAAMIDGCSRTTALFKIVMPMAIPGIVVVFLFSFVFGWSEYLFSLTFARTDEMRTLPVGISLMLQWYFIHFGPMFASGIIAAVPVAVIFAFLQKYLVQGLTGGAIKG